jgi:hypothetical protein
MTAALELLVLIALLEQHVLNVWVPCATHRPAAATCSTPSFNMVSEGMNMSSVFICARS